MAQGRIPFLHYSSFILFHIFITKRTTHIRYSIKIVSVITKIGKIIVEKQRLWPFCRLSFLFPVGERTQTCDGVRYCYHRWWLPPLPFSKLATPRALDFVRWCCLDQTLLTNWTWFWTHVESAVVSPDRYYGGNQSR